MLCRMGYSWNQNLQKIIILVGVISLTAGVLLCFAPASTSSQALLAGMLTGLGITAAVIGCYHLWTIQKLSPEELKKQQNQINDERNQQIVNRSARWTILIVGLGTLLAALLAALLNHPEITFSLVGVIYAILLCFLAACRVIEKKI